MSMLDPGGRPTCSDGAIQLGDPADDGTQICGSPEPISLWIAS